ncbi:phosphatidylserine decarboxylase [Arboricoccus pini]|uniref:Phosphatidylserine decarboxylase proenzyme n=1 Tax=Arboricoccus pini TaxID=1963835 RepID=A0A212QRG1_9PROT|nr:phosphatidylserine decarboxylase [Arboricoccus pini]SNB62170.1 phosphatidylserine decarboxylase [Arboricoccus pini]
MSADRSALSTVMTPIHKAGWPFIAGAFVLAILLGFLWKPLFWLGLIATAWCIYFFRDPRRVTPDDPMLVTSPADGLVQMIRLRRPPPEMGLGDEKLLCVSIFLNIFDVHVNRTPVPGRLLTRAYHPGKFLNAAADKASELNERQSWLIEAADGRKVGLVQIAGFVARRIVSFVEAGAVLLPGDRVGLIRFGSRCDVYLPDGVEPLVIEGQKAVAGETIIARLDGQQTCYQGRET